MTPRQRAAIRRAMTRLEDAAQDKAFQGTIPAGESDYAFAVYEAVDVELERARECMLNLIERYIV